MGRDKVSFETLHGFKNKTAILFEKIKCSCHENYRLQDPNPLRQTPKAVISSQDLTAGGHLFESLGLAVSFQGFIIVIATELCLQMSQRWSFGKAVSGFEGQ